MQVFEVVDERLGPHTCSSGSASWAPMAAPGSSQAVLMSAISRCCRAAAPSARRSSTARRSRWIQAKKVQSSSSVYSCLRTSCRVETKSVKRFARRQSFGIKKLQSSSSVYRS